MRSHALSLVLLANLLSGFLAGCAGESPASATPDNGTPDNGTQTDGVKGWTITPSGGVNAFLDCIEAQGRTLVSAHRGGPKPGFPENAVETFAERLKDGPFLIEFDVAASADGVLYLMHDDTLARTTTGAGAADGRAFSEISALYLKDGEGRRTDYRPPTFAEALGFVRTRTIAQIDFKKSARYEDAIEEIYRQDAADRVILIAYSPAQARKLHRLAPDMMISLSMEDETDLARAVPAAAPANRLLAFTGVRAPSPALNAVLEERDIEVIFGTLGGPSAIDRRIARENDEGAYARIAGTGVDIIATDRPLAARRALLAAGRAVEAGACGVSRN